jgi:ATP-binding cassette subfamily B protein/subfamily B ATP-binding cassette protein MsbA
MATARRWTITGIILTSLLVAVLWIANIGTVYPALEIILKGTSAANYVNEEVQRLTDDQASTIAAIDKLRKKADAPLPEDERTAIIREIEVLQTALLSGQNRLVVFQYIKDNFFQYLPRRPFQSLVIVLVLLVIGTLVKLLALGVNLMLVQELVQRVAYDMRGQLFRKTLHMDVEAFGDHGSSPMLTRLTHDIENVAAGLQTLLGRMIREPLKMLACLSGAAFICFPLLLLVLATSPILALSLSSLNRSVRRANRRVMEEMTQLYGQVNQSLSAIRIVKAYNAHGHERARFRHVALQYYLRNLRLAWYNTLGRSISELLGMSMVVLAILAGSYLVLNQKTSLLGIPMTKQPLVYSEILLFFCFLIGATDPARKLSEVWGSLQRGSASATRIRESLRMTVRVVDPPEPRTVARPHQTLRFDSVGYRYPAGPLVLHQLNLEIRHGETLAIVGPNGSGKSTLVSLLCRWDDPQSGEILIDGVPIRQLSLRDLRRRIGLVTQHPVIFEDTIFNNIRYGSPSATRDAVIEAARQAHADEFIRGRFAEGYETKLGVGSIRLSGGQMQRIALARAMLRNPEIMILDEATSQIDVESEQLIHDALQAFLKGRTGIMITHRQSTLLLAERIAVIEGGRVAAFGTHDELKRTNPFYRSLSGDNYRKIA